jgi:hypothetical protein
MNEEIGTEAAQFPEKEYINGIFVAVHPKYPTLRLSDQTLGVHCSATETGVFLMNRLWIIFQKTYLVP